ncbi:hypothetical protein ABZ079_10285 [Streptomyces sp. NPDC006314]
MPHGPQRALGELGPTGLRVAGASPRRTDQPTGPARVEEDAEDLRSGV